jgi:hypothetical protein
MPTGDPQLVKLTPTDPIRLAPRATYWLVLGTSGDGSFGWIYADGDGQTGAGTLDRYAYSADEGVTWNADNPDNNPYQLEVLVHPVPA